MTRLWVLLVVWQMLPGQPTPRVRKPAKRSGALPRVSTWNAKVGRPRLAVVSDLRRLIRSQDPDVVMLCEAQRYVGVIRVAFAVRWRVYAKRGWAESRMCPIMERRALGKRLRYGKGWGTIRMVEPWTGPQGGSHPGRTWTWIRRGAFLVSTHRAWVGPRGRNREAHMEEAAAMVDFAGDQVDPVAFLGDQNMRPGDRSDGGSSDVAMLIGGHLIYDTLQPTIDHGVVDHDLAGQANHGPMFGSDHHSTRYRLRYR